jgi:hypothetical protein
MGSDIIGWHFKEKSLGDCIIIAPDTYLDDNNILWHTLQVSCSKHPEDCNIFKVSEVRTYIRRDKTSYQARPHQSLNYFAPRSHQSSELPHPLE